MRRWICPIFFWIIALNLPIFSASQGVSQTHTESSDGLHKRKINDRLESYFKAFLPRLIADENITDAAAEVKVPIIRVKEICLFKPDEAILGCVIDSARPNSPLFLFTDYAFYVIKAGAYEVSGAKARQSDYLAADYSQLQAMEVRNVPQGYEYKVGEFVFSVGSDSRIAECLDKVIACLKSETNIFRFEKIPSIEVPPVPFIKGHTLLVFTDRQSDLPAIGKSLDALAATKADTVCIVTNGQMKTFDTPQIIQTSNDDMTLSVIKMAKERNLRIILKPMIDPQDSVWRAWINFLDKDGNQDLAAWQKWWDSYSRFILHNAQIAQQVNAQMLCLGCEMGSTEQFETKWRYLIRQVRQVYHGALTYNINHGPLDSLKWWDALDVVSVSAYYHLEKYVQQAGRTTDPNNPQYQIPLEDMKAGFEIVRQELRQYAEKLNKPIFFIECGVCNGKGCAREPWTHASDDLIYDNQEQARYYTAMFESFYDEPWFIGYAWWAWPAVLYDKDKAATDVGFGIYGKAAEEVVKEWYGKSRRQNTVQKAR